MGPSLRRQCLGAMAGGDARDPQLTISSTCLKFQILKDFHCVLCIEEKGYIICLVESWFSVN